MLNRHGFPEVVALCGGILRTILMHQGEAYWIMVNNQKSCWILTHQVKPQQVLCVRFIWYIANMLRASNMGPLRVGSDSTLLIIKYPQSSLLGAMRGERHLISA